MFSCFFSDDHSDGTTSGGSSGGGTWNCCCICLEDLSDHDLYTHSIEACDIMICETCLQVSDHYSLCDVLLQTMPDYSLLSLFVVYSVDA